MQLPSGYDTRIGEAGKLLSGGQRSESPSRAPLSATHPSWFSMNRAEILIPTPRRKSRRPSTGFEEDRTVICVAHRLSTLANTDGIIVLSEGRIVEQGHYKELLRSNGIFAGLARKQGISH